MLGKWLRLIGIGLLSMWLASGVAYAEEPKSRSEVRSIGNVQVELATPADGLKVGDNDIALQLRDTVTGQPVTRDSVRVDLLMDAGDQSMMHGDMSKQAPVVANLKASKDVPGRYSGKVNLSNAGRWQAKVSLDAQTSTTFNVNVNDGGPNWVIIGGGVGTFALGVIAVAVLKRRASVVHGADTVLGPA